MTGLSREVLAELVAELGPRWQARQDARLADRPRKRAVGADAGHRLVFIDRLLATLVHLRHGVTHDVLARWFAVSRSTITRALEEVRPLLAERGCTVASGIRLHTLADVVALLCAGRQLGLLDATEVRVHRPASHRAGRQRLVSGKPRAHTIKALVITVPPRAHLNAMLPAVTGRSPGRNEPHDLTDSTTHRKPYRPAPPR